MKKSDLVSGKHYLKLKCENEVVLWLGDTVLFDDLSFGYVLDIDENLVGIGIGKNYDDIIAVGERSSNGRIFKDINWIWERKPLMLEGKEVKVGDELYNIKIGMYYVITDVDYNNERISYKYFGEDEWELQLDYTHGLRPFSDVVGSFTRKLPINEVKEVTMDELKDLLGYEVKIKK